jgi:hypothetical protein
MMKNMILLLLCTVCVSGTAFAFDQDQLQIHGFASQGYLRSNHYDYLGAETEEGTVEFNEFGLNVISNLADNLRLGIQFLARDLGDAANDEVEVDWAFGDYRYRNWLGVRAGKLKRALGLYNQSRDIDAARTGVFLPLSVYNETYRTAQQAVKGIGLYGTLPGTFEYQIQYGTLDSEFENNLLARSDVTSAAVDDDAYVLHLGWNTPVDGLKLVGTVSHFFWTTTSTRDTSDVTSDTDFKEWLVGIEYTWGNLTCAAEYDELTFTVNSQVYGDYDYASEYYYGLLTYRFTDWLELGTSYAVFYANKDDREGNNYEQYGMPKAAAWSKDLAVSARFDLNEYWIVKLEGHWINGLSGVSGYGNDPSEDGFLGAAKVTFSF